MGIAAPDTLLRVPRHSSSHPFLPPRLPSLLALPPRRCPPPILASTAITFHVDNTAVTVPLSQAAAMGLSKAVDDVLNTFREKEKAERPKRWESMEFNNTEDGVSLQFFCNPNAYANPFQAKVLLTFNDDKMKIITEGQLSTIKAELDQYVKAVL